MKFYLIAVALVAGLCIVHAADNSTDDNLVTALFSGAAHVHNDLHKFTQQQLAKSYDFLLLSSTFDQYNLDRPGFEKLYRTISDKAWEDTIGLIKYQNKRGLNVTLSSTDPDVVNPRNFAVKDLLASTEISSLTHALGYERKLANVAHTIHRTISHAHHSDGTQYDPDVAHYLDEEIIEHQSGVIRKLTGYIHNLDDIIKEPTKADANTKDLGIHLFDEYLKSAE